MSSPDSAVTLAVIGVLATCVGGLIWVIKFMFTKILPVLEKISKSIENNTKQTKENTLATKSADQYLRERNGRDSKFWQEVSETLQQIVKLLQSKKSMATPVSQFKITRKIENGMATGKKSHRTS